MSRSFERPALLSARNCGVNAILPPLDCRDVFGEAPELIRQSNFP